MEAYVHHLPGRLRVRSPRVKRNHAEASRARDYLGIVEGVKTVDVNALTGSITVIYDPRCLSSDGLVQILCRAGYCDSNIAMGHDGYLQTLANRAGHAVAGKVAGMMVEKVIERSAFALIAAIL